MSLVDLLEPPPPPPPLLVRLGSAHGMLVVARRTDGALCQVGEGYDPAEFAEVVAMVPRRHGEVCFLAAVPDPAHPGPTLKLTLRGEPDPAPVLSYRLAPCAEERFTLCHPSSGKFVCAHPAEAIPAWLTVDASVAGGWEQFAFLAGPDGDAPPALVPLAAVDAAVAGPAEAEFFLRLAGPGQDAANPALAAYARLMDVALLRRQVPKLAGFGGYDALFPQLRSHFAAHEPAFAFDTRTLMRDGIERFGWQIGAHSYGAPEVLDREYGTLSIGRYCSMAGGIQLIVANHATRTTTTYPFAALRRWWPSALDEFQDHPRSDITIGHAVWIGAGACVLPGSRIGHGSVIGARAVVHGEVPPYSVYVGNPGRVVRRLHDDATIARLLALAWWDWPDAKVDRFIPLLLGSDVGAFLDAAEPKVVPRMAAPTEAPPAAPAAAKPRASLFGRLRPFG